MCSSCHHVGSSSAQTCRWHGLVWVKLVSGGNAQLGDPLTSFCQPDISPAQCLPPLHTDKFNHHKLSIHILHRAGVRIAWTPLLFSSNSRPAFFFLSFFSFHGAIHSSESLPASTVKTFSFSRAATTLKLYSETYASHTAHSLVY